MVAAFEDSPIMLCAPELLSQPLVDDDAAILHLPL